MVPTLVLVLVGSTAPETSVDLPCGRASEKCRVERVASGRTRAGMPRYPRLDITKDGARVRQIGSILRASGRRITETASVASIPSLCAPEQTLAVARTPDGAWAVCPYRVIDPSGRPHSPPGVGFVDASRFPVEVVAVADADGRLHVVHRGAGALYHSTLGEERWVSQRLLADGAETCTERARAKRCVASESVHPASIQRTGDGLLLLHDRRTQTARQRCRRVRCEHVVCEPGTLDCMLGVRGAVCPSPDVDVVERCRPSNSRRVRHTLGATHITAAQTVHWTIREVTADWIAARVATDGTVHLVRGRAGRVRYERIRR